MSFRDTLADLWSTMQNQVTRGKLDRAYVSRDGQRTLLQGVHMADETHVDVEYLEPFGRSSLPASKACDYLVVQIGASRDHKVALCLSDPGNRITGLQAGEFGDKGADGSQIVYGVNGIVLTAPDNAFTIKAGSMTFTFDKTGAVTLTGGTLTLNGADGIQLTAPAGTIKANGAVLG